MPTNSGQSSKLRAVLGLSNEKAAYDIFSSSIRQLCLSKLNVNMQGVDIPFETLERIFKEAKHQYPVLLADVDDPHSNVRSALKDYIVLQHKLLRSYASKMRENTYFISPDFTVHNGPTQSRRSMIPKVRHTSVGFFYLQTFLKASTTKRKNDKVESPLGKSLTNGGQQCSSSKLGGSDSVKVGLPNKGGPSLSSSNRQQLVDKQKDNSDLKKHHKKSLTRLGPIDLSAIEDFLQAAKPPLGELLSHFLDAGLHTEEDLRALSHWEEKDIVEFFLTSVRQFDSQMLTTWDIYRLTKHLKGYPFDY
ncbi:hypothetical protein BJ165DRAFT_1615059 [Panaeolus papilionaceus]|nr:hypothetical protein BJ165DRAFT_1615059 [Panaeolus papilionaceus]